jgi:hypothetical protein
LGWAIATVVLGWVAVTVVQLVLARADAVAGRAAAERAKTMTSPDDILRGRPLPSLRAARSRFSRAHTRLQSPFVAPVRALPVVGRQVRAVDALSNAATKVAGTGIEAVTQARGVLDAPHRSGPQRIDVLRRLAVVAERAERDLRGLSLGPRSALIGSVANAHDELAKQLRRTRDGLGRGAAGARSAADLLAGPRRYLILAANNAEMRAGSGMFLSAGVMTTNGGTTDVGDLTSTTDLALPPDAVPLSGDLADRWGWLHPSQEWRNLGASPRFDVTAPLAARMWEAHGGGPVDGVLALDVAALRATLAAVGPVDVNGRHVDSDNVVELLLHQQYVEHAEDPTQATRREELGQIARAVVAAIQDRQWSLAEMARELGAAARGRHILAWSRRVDEQGAWRSAGVDGAVPGGAVLVGILNRGGNKLDRFLQVDATLEVRAPGPARPGRPQLGPGREAVLRVALRNTVPPGEPQYVAGPEGDSGLAEGEYGGIVAVTLPGTVSQVGVGGYASYAAIGSDGPTSVVAPAVRVARGASVTLEFRFTVPLTLRALRVEPSARMPAVRWRFRGDRWLDTAIHDVAW